MTLALAPAGATDLRPWSRRAWLQLMTIISVLAVAEYGAVQLLLHGQKVQTALWMWTMLFEFVLWTTMAPVVIALARRFPLSLSSGSWRTLGVHLGFSLIYSVTECSLRAVATSVVMHDQLIETFGSISAFYGRQLTSYLMCEGIIYWCIVALSQWWDSEHRRSRAESEAVTARMLAVQQSLAPHFTLNALNALVAMLSEGSREQRFAISIGGFMHDLLAARHRITHPLQDECAMICRYLGIEKGRLGERLDVVMDIHPSVCDIEVPVLALQPLLENAVRHAVAPFRDGGKVRFFAFPDGDELVIRIDSEASEAFRPDPGFGYGEDSARSRFDLMYGKRFWFRSGVVAPNRYSVTLSITQTAAAHR